MQSQFDADAFQSFERQGWERKADAYHVFYAPISGYVIGALLDQAAVALGSRILDVGSGPGYVAQRAAARGAKVIGIDQAQAMVNLARHLRPDLEFLVGDAQAPSFPLASFDAVVGNFVLHHLPQQAKALRNFARLLVPGGRVALTVWDDGTRCRFLGLFTDSVRLTGVQPPADLPPGPPMATTDADYQSLLSEAGFSAPQVQTLVYSHLFRDGDGLWNGLLAASVRIAALITGQPPEVQARIRATFDTLIAEYASPQGLDIPVSVKLLSGQVPVN